MLPDEQIHVGSKFVDAYLVEARSIGGISGSPVFVRPSGHINYVEQRDSEIIARSMTTVMQNYFLLGVMKTHWDLEETHMNRGFLKSVNVGIAVVVPAWRLLELLNDPVLVEMRDRNDNLKLAGSQKLLE